MNGNNDLVTKIAGASTLERAKFSPGMLLRHNDLEQLNAYPRELSRLLFRSLFGCGVVCGLVVQPPEEKCDKVWVRVTSGLALDCSGDPIHVPKDSEPLSFDPEKRKDKQLWVLLCGTTRACSPRTSTCESDEESATVPSREKDGYEIRIVRVLGNCVCACLREPKESAYHPGQEPGKDLTSKCPCVGPDHPCYVDHYDGVCCRDGGNDCDCCCDCVVLARLDRSDNGEWTVSHGVRRFVRPVLMRDREVERDRERATAKKAAKTPIASEQVMKTPAANGKAAKTPKPTKSPK